MRLLIYVLLFSLVLLLVLFNLESTELKPMRTNVVRLERKLFNSLQTHYKNFYFRTLYVLRSVLVLAFYKWENVGLTYISKAFASESKFRTYWLQINCSTSWATRASEKELSFLIYLILIANLRILDNHFKKITTTSLHNK